MAPNSLELNSFDYKFYGVIRRRELSCESVILKKSSSDWLNSGKNVIQYLRDGGFSCFDVLQVSAECRSFSSVSLEHKSSF